MKGRGSWIALAGLVLIAAVLALLRGPSQAGDSPEHRSTSDAGNGTSALRLYAEALGHPTSTVEASFELPDRPGLLFVFSPLSSQGYSAADAQLVGGWTSQGGVIIYAAENGDPQLDGQLGVQRLAGSVSADAAVTARFLGGVHRVQGAESASPFRTGPSQVPLFRNARGDVLGITAQLGQGRVVLLSDPLVLCNGYLKQADNGRLAADLIALTPAGGQVLFDEYHHGLVASGPTGPTAWATTRWGLALLWAVAVLFVGCAVRGRAFGPSIPLAPTGGRSTAEYAAAVGRLLQRVGARALTLQTIDAAARRAVGERIGLGRDPQSQGFAAVLAERAPALGGALAAVEAGLAESAQSETRLLESARALHALAYPMPTSPPKESA